MAFDLYPRTRDPELSAELFSTPTAEYRGAPFWAWNNKLDPDQLERQIECFKRMGLGGFHMHSRTGLDTPYLSDEFMNAVKACVEKAKSEQMLAWLYDEDRWPSGAAGGLVTRDKRYRARQLRFARAGHADEEGATGGRITLLARYAVRLDAGRLAEYHRLEADAMAAPGEAVWCAYLEQVSPSSWFNNEAYVDTLNPDAVRRFVEVTFERYKECIGGEFGKTVPAVFTDEPQYTRMHAFSRPDADEEIILPWTDDFADTYRQTYGENLLDLLPELFWELSDAAAVSRARYRYHDHLAERFAAGFADVVGAWCEKHDIALTGHLNAESTLYSQSSSIGDAMRSYRSFQLPGIDMLCDWMELSTAKQAQSAAHQYDRPGVLSELYGVTNWDFDFVGHKGQGDWQAALGVTVRVHHLSLVSMAGEAKRDYPASINYQSPWHEEYPLVEDHFARLNTVLTRGKPVVRVAVIHPVESYWLAWGPVQQTQLERSVREEDFDNVIRWLLYGQIDFDFVCEALLPAQCPRQEGDRFRVGAMAYAAVIVPNLRTIRSTTMERLEAFRDAGGTVLFLGEPPAHVDAEPSDLAERLAENCPRAPMNRARLLQALSPYRKVEVRLAAGNPAQTILYQLRAEGENRYLFLCNTDRLGGYDGAEVRLEGLWTGRLLDTMSGFIRPQTMWHEDGWTVIPWDIAPHGHMLLTLEPAAQAVDRLDARTAEVRGHWREHARLDGPVPVTLHEPNVLVLDQAEWRLDEGEWRPREEILRLDNEVRQQLGFPLRFGHMAQPWTDTEEAPVAGMLQLRFRFVSEIPVTGARLALEEADATTITLNGETVSAPVEGYWVDEAIRTVALPDLAAGENELILSVPFHRKRNVEWGYLLGDFGVDVRGREARLTVPVRELAFGDWVHQGLPFYAGNLTYHIPVNGIGREIGVHFPKFKAPLLAVALDGKRLGPVAFRPFRIGLGSLGGEHDLDVTAYGNRINAFGQLHNSHPDFRWYGPNSWRTTGDIWAYEYQLEPMGILSAPRVEVLQP